MAEPGHVGNHSSYGPSGTPFLRGQTCHLPPPLTHSATPRSRYAPSVLSLPEQATSSSTSCKFSSPSFASSNVFSVVDRETLGLKWHATTEKRKRR